MLRSASVLLPSGFVLMSVLFKLPARVFARWRYLTLWREKASWDDTQLCLLFNSNFVTRSEISTGQEVHRYTTLSRTEFHLNMMHILPPWFLSARLLNWLCPFRLCIMLHYCWQFLTEQAVNWADYTFLQEFTVSCNILLLRTGDV